MLIPEWSKQDGILLTWPHKNTDWVNILPHVEQTYCDLVKAISEYQHVYIICFDEELVKHTKSLLNKNKSNLSNIYYFIIQTNDTWVRDYGPLTSLKSGTLAIENFQFNGWGHKFSFELDNQSTQKLFDCAGFKNNNVIDHNFILEGGSIESNGSGVLLTTSNCLLTHERATNGSQNEIELFLKNVFKLDEVLWLQGQLPGDDTDGHIDTLARFCSEKLICCVKDVFEQLIGTDFDIVELPTIEPIYSLKKAPLPATYANFLITNQEVILPVYNDDNDDKACSIIQACFPTKKVRSINALPLIQQHGSIHCITMQIPEGVFK